MKIEEIKELINIFEDSELSELKYKHDNNVIHMKKPSANAQIINPVPYSATQTTNSTSNTTENNVSVTNGTWIKAPFVGVFYAGASQESSPYVKVGQSVKEGDTLCIIEAMKVMNEIKSTVTGVVKEIKAQNGKMVEYDEEMILIGD